MPLMWAWAGHIRPGTTSGAVVGHIDLYPTLLDLVGVPRPAQQRIDGVSYARVLKSEGGLDRAAFFNYFPHGGGPGRAGGVWVRAGDTKLIRWFGVTPEDETRYELYNLREDLSETKNLATAQPERVKELDALIDGFLTDTGATYPRPNPAYQPTAARPANPKAADDPLEGWKARQCAAAVKDGVLTMTGTGKAGAAFLGHGTGQLNGPAVVKMRVRAGEGGAGKVEWVPQGAADPSVVKSVPLNVAAGDWQEVTVDLAEPGPLGTLRLYLPAGTKPLELDWVELRGIGAKPQRWDFNAK